MVEEGWACQECGATQVRAGVKLFLLPKHIVRREGDEVVRLADAGVYCQRHKPEIPRRQSCGCLYSFKDYRTLKYCESCKKKYPRATAPFKMKKGSKVDTTPPIVNKSRRRIDGSTLAGMASQY